MTRMKIRSGKQIFEVEKEMMKKLRLFVIVLLVLAISSVSAQAQRKHSTADRPVSSTFQRLRKSHNRFQASLNAALVNERIDQTRPENDINTFDPGFRNTLDQSQDQFNRHRLSEVDVQNLMQKATLVNGFISRNSLNKKVQSDWNAVRTDLNSLANAYGIIWQWNQPAQSRIRLSLLSDSALNQLIARIETGGDQFRLSLTDAFSKSRYDTTRGEGNMNDAVMVFKRATDQLRFQFDAKQPVTTLVEQVLARATPLDTYMRNNTLTTQAQSDWSILRGDLKQLGAAYNLAAN